MYLFHVKRNCCKQYEVPVLRASEVGNTVENEKSHHSAYNCPKGCSLYIFILCDAGVS